MHIIKFWMDDRGADNSFVIKNGIVYYISLMIFSFKYIIQKNDAR